MHIYAAETLSRTKKTLWTRFRVLCAWVESNAMTAQSHPTNTKSCRLKKKSITQSAQNAAKSLIGEAWTKYCSTMPTTSTVPRSSIPAPRGCKLARSKRERRVPLRHALPFWCSIPEARTNWESSLAPRNSSRDPVNPTRIFVNPPSFFAPWQGVINFHRHER